MKLCDSHAHLSHTDVFDNDREAVVRRAGEAGVRQILNVATGLDDAAASVEAAGRHPGLLAAVGIHPHEAGQATGAAMETLERLARSPEVVAWGEIGLDFHYLHAPAKVQEEAFALQLQMAARLNLPVSVHTRQADEATLRLLKHHLGPARGVIHCFTGDWALATACLDLGLHLSFSGILTFKSADNLRNVARRVPASRLLVETDSPYLSPVPHRGGRNEPARVVEVARVLAELHDLPLPEMAQQTSINFSALFQPGLPAGKEAVSSGGSWS